MNDQAATMELLPDGRLYFSGGSDFQAYALATKWCRDNGISYGSTQCGVPVGLMRGDCDISKWRNLSQEERAQLDGTISGDFRNGPLILQMKHVNAEESK